MKKHFHLLIFFFLLALCSQAQIKKGDILLGGDIGFYSQKTDPGIQNNNYLTKQTSLNLSPSIAKAIKNNLLAGIDLAYSGSTTTQSSGVYGGSTLKVRTYGAGFFLRSYKPLGSGFSLFMQSRLGGSYSTQKNTYDNFPGNNSDLKGYSIDLGFYPGIAYAITKKVQLETGFQNILDVSYAHSKNTVVTDPATSTATSSKTNTFSLQSGLSNSLAGFVIGVRVLLGS